ncbi:MAG TPA: tRNA lysidine(34) synthetase TilS [Tepidiformaceae bacterium]
MFRRVGKVLVALSGGPDSVTCLLLLRDLQERLGFEVVAAHFDHQLRAESAAEMENVRALCDRLGVHCLTGEGDVRSVAAQTRSGIEETARRMRYQFLAFIAGNERADCIATGHTRDDQAETVLMRIVRGTGVRGIRGMLPVAAVPGAEAQRLVRPLLVLTREDTLAICREAGIEPILDPSNDDLAFGRNRLRHETLATLRSANPSIDDALVGLAESAREVFAGVERQSFAVQPLERGPDGAIFDLTRVRDLPNEALMLVVEREAGFYSLPFEVNRTRVKNLRTVLGSGTGTVRFGQVWVDASGGRVRIGPELQPPEAFEPKVLNVPGITIAGPWRVQVSTDPLAAEPGTGLAAVSLAGTKGAIRIRPLRPGDRIALHGRDAALKNVLANAKVPRWQREGLLAITDSERVLALIGGPQKLAIRAEGDDALFVRVSPARPS